MADALACGVAMHRAIDRLGRRNPVLRLAIRVGISVGEATTEDNDWFGTPVVEAARLCAAGQSGQIMATDVVRALVGSRGGHQFSPLGAVTLKGLPEPVPVCEVGWEADPVLAALPLAPALHRDRRAAFVGRAQETELLERAWSQTQAGRRRVVVEEGETTCWRRPASPLVMPTP